MKTHPGSYTWRNFSFFFFFSFFARFLLINVARRPVSVNNFNDKYSSKTNKQTNKNRPNKVFPAAASSEVHCCVFTKHLCIDLGLSRKSKRSDLRLLISDPRLSPPCVCVQFCVCVLVCFDIINKSQEACLLAWCEAACATVGSGEQ